MKPKRIAILVDNYFEQAEFEEPMDAFKDAGIEVVVVAAKTKQLQGLNHVDKGDTFQADILLADVSSDEFDALVLPGGVVNSDSLRMVEPARQWVKDFLDSGRLVAAICHAPWLLVSADVVQGRKITSFFTIQDDVDNAGGEWVDQQVVVDGNLITSRKPDDIPAFNQAILRTLAPDAVNEEEEEDEDDSDERLLSLGYDKQRDEISESDKRDILGDEDADDEENLHPSDVTPADEKDGTQ